MFHFSNSAGSPPDPRLARKPVLTPGELERLQPLKYKKVSIVIPVYNEARTIRELFEKVAATDLGMPKEIIVVDDGSTDGTADILRKLHRQPKTGGNASPCKGRFFFSEKNRGKGSAARTGISNATGDIILFQDADLELDPADYPQLIDPILAGKTKVVFGVRNYMAAPGATMAGKLANLFLSALTTILYGSVIADMETAYKAFDADAVKALDLKAMGFEFEPEITAKTLRAGHKIHQVSVRYWPRTAEEGKKIRWLDGLKAIWWLLKCRFETPAGSSRRDKNPS